MILPLLSLSGEDIFCSKMLNDVESGQYKCHGFLHSCAIQPFGDNVFMQPHKYIDLAGLDYWMGTSKQSYPTVSHKEKMSTIGIGPHPLAEGTSGACARRLILTYVRQSFCTCKCPNTEKLLPRIYADWPGTHGKAHARALHGLWWTCDCEPFYTLSLPSTCLPLAVRYH